MMQPNFLILFFLALSVFLMLRNRMLLAGASLGFAIQIREYLAVMLLLLLLKKNWRAIIGVILAVILLRGAAIIAFGWPVEMSYWKYILSFGRAIHLSMHNFSFPAYIYRFGQGLLDRSLCSLFAVFSSLLFLGLSVFWTRKKGADISLIFSIFLVLCFLVAPWIHESHYVALYIPILICWFKLENNSKYSLFVIFVMSYLLLGLRYSLIGFPRFYYGAFSFFNFGKLLGVILLFLLVGRLILNDNKPENNVL